MSRYPIVTFYGYRVIFPEDVDAVSYRADLYSLQPALPEPFRVINLLSTASMDATYTDEEYDTLDTSTTLWVGFCATDLANVIALDKELTALIRETILFDGVSFEEMARFHSGTEWILEEDSEEDVQESEEEEDEEEEEEEEDEEEEEEDEEDEEEEEEEENDSEEDDG